LKQLFAVCWPELEKRVEDIPEEAPSEKHMRPQHEILEELVTGVRALDGRFRELEGAVVEHGPRSRRRRMRHIHPMMIDEMAHMASEDGDDPIALLLLAGLVRDDFPWFYEVAVEAYREMRLGDAKATQKALERLRRVIKVMGRGPFMDDFMHESKEMHMVMRELPMMLDHFLHRFELRLRPGESAESAGPEGTSASTES
jgi:hypothetical protein